MQDRGVGPRGWTEMRTKISPQMLNNLMQLRQVNKSLPQRDRHFSYYNMKNGRTSLKHYEATCLHNAESQVCVSLRLVMREGGLWNGPLQNAVPHRGGQRQRDRNLTKKQIQIKQVKGYKWQNRYTFKEEKRWKNFTDWSKFNMASHKQQNLYDLILKLCSNKKK